MKEGIKEIILLGQIVTNFGKREIHVSEDGKTPFVQLLDAIHEIEGIERIRFTAPHPKGYGDDLIESYQRLPKLCQSAHIPVQSGSNRILKEMHRGYTGEHFLEILSKLRNVQPSMGIATDIIVGFQEKQMRIFKRRWSWYEKLALTMLFYLNIPQGKVPQQQKCPIKCR